MIHLVCLYCLLQQMDLPVALPLWRIKSIYASSPDSDVHIVHWHLVRWILFVMAQAFVEIQPNPYEKMGTILIISAGVRLSHLNSFILPWESGIRVLEKLCKKRQLQWMLPCFPRRNENKEGNPNNMWSFFYKKVCEMEGRNKVWKS